MPTIRSLSQMSNCRSSTYFVVRRRATLRYGTVWPEGGMASGVGVGIASVCRSSEVSPWYFKRKLSSFSFNSQ
jgi:hypothetical protein